jgi:hypothetical protein
LNPALPESRHDVAARLAAGGAVMLLAAAAGVLRIRSVDFFWHLAAGRWILEHRALPRLDPFRFTASPTPWVDHEWGFQVILALAERLGGLHALVAGRAAVMVALAGLLLAGLRSQGVPAAAAALVATATVAGLRSRFLLRPELLSLVAFAVLLLLLRRLRHARRRGLLAGSILALVAVWANLHPGVLAAPVAAALYLAGAFWQDRRRADPPPLSPARAAALAGGAGLAILANPWGAHLYAVPWTIARALSGLPLKNPDWAPLWERPQPLLFAALAALATLLVVTRRRVGDIDLPLALVLAGLLPLVATSARHQGLVWIAAALLAGECLGRLTWEGRLGPAWEGRQAALAASLTALAAGLWFVRAPAGGPWGSGHEAGFGIAPGLFPERAVDALAGFEPVGNLFNSPAFGGYLLWRLYPPRQVFVDTRNEVDPGLLRELVAARSGTVAWEALLARYRIDAALVGYEERPRAVASEPTEAGSAPAVEHVATSALLFPRERFALVFWDDVSMLFLARTPERAAGLVGRESRFIQPEDWRNLLARARRDAAFRREAARELTEKLAQDPSCRRAAALAELLERGR